MFLLMLRVILLQLPFLMHRLPQRELQSIQERLHRLRQRLLQVPQLYLRRFLDLVAR